jgi:hypothetical protein
VAQIYSNGACAGAAHETSALSTQCLANQQDDDHLLAPFLVPPYAARSGRPGSAGSGGVKVEAGDAGGRSSRDGYGEDSTVGIRNGGSARITGSDTELSSPLLRYGLVSADTSDSVSTQGLCVVPVVPGSDDEYGDDDVVHHHGSALSAGAIVAIVLASVIGAAAVVYLVYYAVFLKRK